MIKGYKIENDKTRRFFILRSGGLDGEFKTYLVVPDCS
jgi:hypothetical protein